MIYCDWCGASSNKNDKSTIEHVADCPVPRLRAYDELAALLLRFESDYSYAPDDWVLRSQDVYDDLNKICNTARTLLGIYTDRPEDVYNHDYYQSRLRELHQLY